MNKRFTYWECVNEDDPAEWRVDDENEGRVIAWCDSQSDARRIAAAMNLCYAYVIEN